MKFESGDKVKVIRIKPKNHGEYTYGSNRYPKIGWEGILKRKYDYYEWVIEWTNTGGESVIGDLVKDWMLCDIEKKEIKPFGIVTFCKEIYK